MKPLFQSTLGRNLRVATFAARKAMGGAAADLVHGEVTRRVRRAGKCRILFGCAPSQDDFFAALRGKAGSAAAVWCETEVFHMDEYIGFDASHPQSFRNYLRKHFLSAVAVRAFHPILGEANDPATEARRYDTMLRAAPIDIVCLGFGENGHLAFNDPPVANFNDPVWAKIVEIDEICRQQQVNDGCFATFDEVPRQAVTITLPVFSHAEMLCGVVPTVRKAQAVRNALLGPIGPQCPASMLRQHPNAHLFLDRDAASLLPDPMTSPTLAAD